MNQEAKIAHGPKIFRVAIYFFSFLLTILLIWLGNFVLRDIETIRPSEIIETELLEQKQEYQDQIKEIDRQVEIVQEKRKYLEDSTAASQQTLNQLLELHRQSIEKSVPISPEESRAFAESQRIFLDNQQQLQSVMTNILKLQQEKRKYSELVQQTDKEIGQKRRPILQRHRRLIALLKFLFIAPLIALGTWLFILKRTSSHAPLIYALDAAVLYLLIKIIHQHFPARHYKYIFIVTGIIAVLLILRYLIRLFLHPSKAWLFKKYKEAYQQLRCPVCQYPLLPGNLKALLTRGEPFKHALPLFFLETEGIKEYRCPSCGTTVFETCTNCQHLRHSLLPYCYHCGTTKQVP